MSARSRPRETCHWNGAIGILVVMVMGFWKRRTTMNSGEVARQLHSLWLTKALTTRREYPRIPIRAVDSGGFSRLMDRPGGPTLAERWWACTLDRVDDVDPGE